MTQAEIKTEAPAVAEAVPANGELKRLLAKAPHADFADIMAGVEQEYVSYDGRVVKYTLNMLWTILGETFKYASREEASTFIAWCINNRLDPVRKQAYFIKYKEGAVPAFVVSWFVFLDRAQRHPAFNGMENGIVWQVKDADGMRTVRGRPCDYQPDADHVRVGGWARVYRKDRQYAADIEVPLSEMKNPMSPTWKNMETTMATKTPTARALRQSFPEDLADMLAEGESLVQQVAEPSPAPEADADAPQAPTREERQAEPEKPAAPPTQPSPCGEIARAMRRLFPQEFPEGDPNTREKFLAAVPQLAAMVRKCDLGMFRLPVDLGWADTEIVSDCIRQLDAWKAEGVTLPPELFVPIPDAEAKP